MSCNIQLIHEFIIPKTRTMSKCKQQKVKNGRIRCSLSSPGSKPEVFPLTFIIKIVYPIRRVFAMDGPKKAGLIGRLRSPKIFPFFQ